MTNNPPRKRVCLSFLGSTLDAGTGPRRWERWRPTIACAQHEDLRIDRFEIFTQRKVRPIFRTVSEDLAAVSPESEINAIDLPLRDPWDFEEVFAKLGHAPSRRLTEPADHHLLLAEVANGRGIGFIPKSMTKVRRAGATFRPLKEKEFWIGFGLAYRNAQHTSELDALLRVARRKTALLTPGME